MVDEGCFGANKGIRKGNQRPHGLPVKCRITKKTPAHTTWRKGTPRTVSWKRKSNSSAADMVGKRVKRKNAKPKTTDKRKNGLWVWVAVECGQLHGKCKSHPDGTKRVVLEVMKTPQTALEGKPRGAEEIKLLMKSHIRKGSFVVADSWKATEKAVKALGYKMPDRMVNHSLWFRDPLTGFHSNDAESAISRVKTWLRKKYGRLVNRGTQSIPAEVRLQQHLDEYMLYTNVGNSTRIVMRAFQCVNGTIYKPCDI